MLIAVAVALATGPAALASVKSSHKRDIRAYRIALTQRGVPYRLGAEAPGRAFDCSGLVQWAYRRAGVSLPRTTYAMVRSWHLVRVSRPAKGDLAFASNNGHVEFVDRGTRGNLWTFGAHHSGTRAGYVHSSYYFQTFYRVRRLSSGCGPGTGSAAVSAGSAGTGSAGTGSARASG